MEVAVSEAIYRVDAVVRRSQALQAHPLNQPPRAVVNPADAESVGLAPGATGRFSTASGTATLPVELNPRVAPGTVWIETGHAATAPLRAGRLQVGRA